VPSILGVVRTGHQAVGDLSSFRSDVLYVELQPNRITQAVGVILPVQVNSETLELQTAIPDYEYLLPVIFGWVDKKLKECRRFSGDLARDSTDWQKSQAHDD
jgi:hypothetical protein